MLGSVARRARQLGPSACVRFASTDGYYVPHKATDTRTKPYYVTTPIFYVNAAPHIGHLHSMVLSDVSKRWRVFMGDSNAVLTTGTDEHGVKVARASAKASMPTKQFVDLTAAKFRELTEAGNISYNRFIRTTDSDHKVASQALWKLLEANGFIYKGTHTGWYCVSDETFYPETQIEKITDAVTGAQMMVSKETGKPVELTSEENYFFALSKLREPLLQHLRVHTDFVVPKEKWSFVEREVDLGLEDLSISRPRSRCPWGIPVPGDDSQVMYVWLDALTNYLTSAKFPWKSASDYEASVWPANAHVIGKDIVRFHAIYWPAFLLAAGIPLPKQIVVHSHWTMEGAKMSKSSGNVVDPIYLMDSIGADSVRYFLANDGYLDHDTPFSHERVLLRHNVDLVNRYGNLLMRTCGPKFDIARALTRDVDSIVEKRGAEFQSLSDIADRHKALVHDTNTLVSRVDTHMQAYDPARGLNQVLSLIRFVNLFLQDSAPWVYKTDEVVQLQDAIIKDAAEATRVASIVLTPFIPQIAHGMLDRLAVRKANRKLKHAVYNGDLTYGRGANRKGDYPLSMIEIDPKSN